MKFVTMLIAVFLLPTEVDIAEAKQYPIFDGQKYNGLYYPRVDIIEWGKPAHLEFHVYSKDEPIDIEAKTIERKGKRVLLVNYYFTKRKEKVCRSVIAPANFAPDAKLYFYKDGSDNEYDNIYVSVNPQTTTKNLQAYPVKEFNNKNCDDNSEEGKIADSENSNKNTSASEGSLAGRGVASEVKEQTKPATKSKELIDYENNAMPFNF